MLQSIAQDQDLVGDGHQRRAVRDQDHGRPARLQCQQGLHQGRIPGLIQTGVRFVQNHQSGTSVQGPGQRNALALTTGERLTLWPHRGVVAQRKCTDAFIHAHQTRSLLNPLHVDVAEPGDVLRHRTLEEFNPLREVAQVGTECGLVP